MTTETENKTSAFVISLGIHTLLLAFLFLFILHTPNPPFSGGSGVVLNLGYVDEGTGEVQTLNDANDSPLKEENKPLEEQAKPIDNQEATLQELKSANDGNLVTSDEESEVKSVPTEKEESKTETVKAKAKSSSKEEVKKVEDKKVNPAALFGGQSGNSTKGGNNNGDKNGAVGDQGNPQGDVNAKALYGNAGTGGDGNGGSGGGASLDLAGWKWAKKPKVKDDNEDENGKIVYQITIDDQGDLINLKLLETTVSPAVEKIYRQEVEKLSFIKTDNKAPGSTSSGKITFIIKVK